MPSEPARTPAPRCAIVTGASRGIGRAIAARLLADGWSVLGLSREAPAAPFDAIAQGASFTALGVDLTNPQSVAEALHHALALHGTPQAVVHAAGVLKAGALGAVTAADAHAMWQLHVQAATQLADTLLPRMAQAGRGRLVLVGSRVASGMAGRSQYAATKAAMVALARSWAAEVVAHGVTVNVVAPAATDTGMLADPNRAKSAVKLPPMGRLIQPAEVAALVAFLLSDDAAPITGQALVVCGGSSLSG